MSIAWIFLRSSDGVREYWNSYRQSCLRWLRPDGQNTRGYILKQPPHITVRSMLREDAVNRGLRRIRREGPTAHEARDALWRCLADGSLRASGLLVRSNERVAIPPELWIDLRPYEWSGGDEFRANPEASVGSHVYRGVRLERARVMAIWNKRRRQPAPAANNESTTPVGDGFMPMYCAAHWIATRGNKIDIDLVDEAGWVIAYRQLIDALVSDRVKVIGSHNSSVGTVPGHYFASCRVQYPYSPPENDIWSKDEVLLRCCPYLTEREWRDGFDDRLTLRRGDQWIQLQVEKAAVAAIWPFGLRIEETEPKVERIRTGAPGRPSPMYLVVREHERRLASSQPLTGVKAEAEGLAEWLRNTHPDVPPLTAKAIENKIRKAHREAK